MPSSLNTLAVINNAAMLSLTGLESLHYVNWAVTISGNRADMDASPFHRPA